MADKNSNETDQFGKKSGHTPNTLRMFTEVKHMFAAAWADSKGDLEPILVLTFAKGPPLYLSAHFLRPDTRASKEIDRRLKEFFALENAKPVSDSRVTAVREALQRKLPE